MKQFKQVLILLSIMFLGLLFTGCSTTPFELEATAEIESELIPSPNGLQVIPKVDFRTDPTPGFVLSFAMIAQASEVSHYKVGWRVGGSADEFRFDDTFDIIPETTTADTTTQLVTLHNPNLTTGFSNYEFKVRAISDHEIAGPASEIASANFRGFKDRADTLGTDGIIGSEGSANGQFQRPTDVVLDSNGKIYVYDSGNNRIQKFNSTGTTHEATVAGLNSPNGGLCIDSNNNIIATNSNTDELIMFNTSLEVVAIPGVAGGRLNGNTPGLETLLTPSNCFFTESNLLIITGVDSNKIYLSDSADLTRFSSVGISGNDIDALAFQGPFDVTSVSVVGNEIIVLLDKGNNRIHLINSTDLSQLISISLEGDINQAENIAAITATIADQLIPLVYISDTRNNQIKAYTINTTTGITLTKVGQWGISGNDFAEFNSPKGIHVLANGTVFIVDSNNNRIQVFKD